MWLRTGTQRAGRHAALAAALLVLLVGCALVPGAPAGPIFAPGVHVGATYAYAYAPSTARTLQPSGAPYTLRGGSAMFRGLVPLVPLRAQLRASPFTFLDVGADLGWMDAGLQLRAGPLDARRSLPWGIELEWRTGQRSFFEYELARRMRTLRARAELYPRLGRFAALDAFGAFTLGVASGTLYHFMHVPAAFDQTIEGPTTAGLEIARHETRLEASLGVHGHTPHASFGIALQPWLTLHQGTLVGAECGACSLEFRSLDAPWGIGLVASGTFGWEMR